MGGEEKEETRGRESENGIAGREGGGRSSRGREGRPDLGLVHISRDENYT